jgi:hypothetical protein
VTSSLWADSDVDPQSYPVETETLRVVWNSLKNSAFMLDSMLESMDMDSLMEEE